MKTNLIITIPVSTEGVIQNYNAASSIEKKFDCLKPILSELFGCAGIDISANVNYVQPKDERTEKVVRESHKRISGKAFNKGDSRDAGVFPFESERCFKVPSLKIKLRKPINIIEQKNSTQHKHHAIRPVLDILGDDLIQKTFCGVKFEDRKGWTYHGQNVELEKAQEAVSCMMCMKGLRSYIKKVE